MTTTTLTPDDLLAIVNGTPERADEMAALTELRRAVRAIPTEVRQRLAHEMAGVRRDDGPTPQRLTHAIAMFLSATNRLEAAVLRQLEADNSPVKVVGVELPGES